MILVDSSAWIDFDKANESPADRALTALIAAGSSEIACTEPVLMEVLAGVKSDVDRRCRQQGITALRLHVD